MRTGAPTNIIENNLEAPTEAFPCSNEQENRIPPGDNCLQT